MATKKKEVEQISARYDDDKKRYVELTKRRGRQQLALAFSLRRRISLHLRRIRLALARLSSPARPAS